MHVMERDLVHVAPLRVVFVQSHVVLEGQPEKQAVCQTRCQRGLELMSRTGQLRKSKLFCVLCYAADNTFQLAEPQVSTGYQ